jgi:hypothetical protein
MTATGPCALLLLGLLCATRAHAQDAGACELPFEVAGPAFVAIQVRDDSAAADWYRRVFCLDELRYLAAEDGRYTIRILSRPGLSVEVIRSVSTREGPNPGFGLFKAGLFVDDIDAAYRWLEEMEAERDARLFVDTALQVRTFVLRDPAGNRLQLFERCDTRCDP